MREPSLSKLGMSNSTYTFLHAVCGLCRFLYLLCIRRIAYTKARPSLVRGWGKNLHVCNILTAKLQT